AGTGTCIFATTPISGTSRWTYAGRSMPPRGAKARSRAAFASPLPACPEGGPPQMPHLGLAHWMGPVHGCLIAYRPWKLLYDDGRGAFWSRVGEPGCAGTSRPPMIAGAALNTRSSASWSFV